MLQQMGSYITKVWSAKPCPFHFLLPLGKKIGESSYPPYVWKWAFLILGQLAPGEIYLLPLISAHCLSASSLFPWSDYWKHKPTSVISSCFSWHGWQEKQPGQKGENMAEKRPLQHSSSPMEWPFHRIREVTAEDLWNFATSDYFPTLPLFSPHFLCKLNLCSVSLPRLKKDWKCGKHFHTLPYFCALPQRREVLKAAWNGRWGGVGICLVGSPRRKRMKDQRD